MIIPQKYQVFDAPVVITDKDEARLLQHLSCWKYLHKRMLEIPFNIPDLQRLVVLELLHQQRSEIFKRLIGRLGSLQRTRVKARIKKALR